MGHVLTWVNDPQLWFVDGIGAYRAQTETEFTPVWQALLQHENAWMLSKEGQIVGHVGWVEPADACAELYITIGDRSHRRTGLGRHALRWVEARAAVLGMRRLIARVLEVNEPGLAFFEALGYRVVPALATELEREGDLMTLQWLEKTVPLAAR